ncbi:MAG TPA: radical SAM protein [Symbiobacteriaceae bacterium]|jgi:pyruvate formate-lyase activating enzyme-like uncharacterized protein
MIVDLNRANLGAIRNRDLRAYAEVYAEIYDQFADTVRQTGIEFDPDDEAAKATARRDGLRDVLRAKGAGFRNNGHSIHTGPISPACEACAQGMGSATFYTSLRCHRSCFYCFNPNQEDYDQYNRVKRDVAAELVEMAAGGYQVGHLALTGGEPLLFPEEAVAFFRTAREQFPAVHTRLYTSGDHVDRELLARFQAAGLDEIRFSVRAHDSAAARRHTYERIALAREFVPAVMVETPVLPGTLDIMKEMLRELERLQVFGVNLLEFGFPFHNAEEFRRRGYKVKNRPYETLYDYWYAGGLPVAGSELDCLALLAYMLDEGMGISGHYCSLENKHTGQVFQQSWGAELPEVAYASERDYFWKSAKVFGADVTKVQKVFGRAGYRRYVVNQAHRYLEFHPSRVADLKELDVEVGICTYVVERRPEGSVLRELKVGLTTPQTFDPGLDL